MGELAAGLGVGADVAFPGFVPNPFAYMARAAVFVLSSRHEGLPGVLIQARACGCPVVSTDCPSGPREILERGLHDPLVPVGDDAAMARSILRALDEPPARASLQARAAVSRSSARWTATSGCCSATVGASPAALPGGGAATRAVPAV